MLVNLLNIVSGGLGLILTIDPFALPRSRIGIRAVLRETVLLPKYGGVPWTVGSAVESRSATPDVTFVVRARQYQGN